MSNNYIMLRAMHAVKQMVFLCEPDPHAERPNENQTTPKQGRETQRSKQGCGVKKVKPISGRDTHSTTQGAGDH